MISAFSEIRNSLGCRTENWLYSVEWVEAGETVDNESRQ